MKGIFFCLVLFSFINLFCDLSRAGEIKWVSAPQRHDEVRSGKSRHPALSADGRFVVFQSNKPLLEEDEDRLWDVYLFDRKKEILEKISPNNRQEANGGPTISSNGEVVAYHVYPEWVLKREKPRVSDVVTFNRKKKRFDTMTMAYDQSAHDGESLAPALTTKGRYVVFTSNATNLLKKKTNPFRKVYVANTKKRSLKLVSQSLQGEPADRPCVEPKITQDGRLIFFKSAATNLLSPQSGDGLTYHLYVYDRKKEELMRLDSSELGWDSESFFVGQYSLDAVGKWVLMEAISKNPHDPEKELVSSDLFMFDYREKTITPFAMGPFKGKVHSPSLSGDGRYVVFIYQGFGKDQPGSLIVMERESKIFHKIYEGGVKNPVLSRDGKVVAFESEDGGLRQDDDDELNVFVVENPFFHSIIPLE